MANIDKSSLSYQTLAQLKAAGRKTTAGEIVSALIEANPDKEIASASIGSFLNKFDVYKVANRFTSIRARRQKATWTRHMPYISIM